MWFSVAASPKSTESSPKSRVFSMLSSARLSMVDVEILSTVVLLRAVSPAVVTETIGVEAIDNEL